MDLPQNLTEEGRTLQERLLAHEIEASYLKSIRLEKEREELLDQAQAEVKDSQDNKALYNSNVWLRASEEQRKLFLRLRKKGYSKQELANQKAIYRATFKDGETDHSGLRSAINRQTDSFKKED